MGVLVSVLLTKTQYLTFETDFQAELARCKGMAEESRCVTAARKRRAEVPQDYTLLGYSPSDLF